MKHATVTSVARELGAEDRGTPRAPAGSGVAARDRSNPSLFDALRGDPTLPIDRDALEDIVTDLRRPSRRYLFPVIHLLVRLAVRVILFVKRVVPFELAS